MASMEALRAYRKINIKSSLIRQGAEDHQRSVKAVVYLTSCTASTILTVMPTTLSLIPARFLAVFYESKAPQTI
jgi:hypothetical protein